MIFYVNPTTSEQFAYPDQATADEWRPANLVACPQCPGHPGTEVGQYQWVSGAWVQNAPTLAQAQATQTASMVAAYVNAIAQDVTRTTAGGVTKAYQADPDSVQKVMSMLAAYTPSGAVPSGFQWKSSDNSFVTFTLADLQGLAKAMGDQGWTAFERLQQRKSAIMSAATVADVEAVVW